LADEAGCKAFSCCKKHHDFEICVLTSEAIFKLFVFQAAGTGAKFKSFECEEAGHG
jgi:hypothetical protein